MEVHLSPRYLAATCMPSGFAPPQSPGGLPDVTNQFDASVSKAIRAYEAGAELPASGVLVQSARLSRERGFRVFYKLQWADGVPTDEREIGMAPSRDSSVDYPPPRSDAGQLQLQSDSPAPAVAAATAASGTAGTVEATSNGADRHVGRRGRLFAQGHETARSTLRRELSRYSSFAEVHNRPFVIRQVQVPLVEAADFVAALCIDAKYPKYYLNELTSRKEKFVLQIDVDKAKKTTDPVLRALRTDEYPFVLGVDFRPARTRLLDVSTPDSGDGGSTGSGGSGSSLYGRGQHSTEHDAEDMLRLDFNCVENKREAVTALNKRVEQELRNLYDCSKACGNGVSTPTTSSPAMFSCDGSTNTGTRAVPQTSGSTITSQGVVTGTAATAVVVFHIFFETRNKPPTTPLSPEKRKEAQAQEVPNGISVKFLRAVQKELLRMEPKADKLTTDDVVNMFVKLHTRAVRHSFMMFWKDMKQKMVAKQRRESQQHDKGRETLARDDRFLETCLLSREFFDPDESEYFNDQATHFVSHSWSGNFFDLVNTVCAHLEQDPNADSYFLWIDCFVVNQHTSELEIEFSFEWWTTTFKKQIETTPNGTLLICTPWDRPTTLTRSWCLWEIWCSIEQEDRCKVVIPRHEAVDMIRSLKEDKTLERIAFALTNIEVRNAEARSEKDRAGILKAIVRSKGGPDRVNEAIAKQMRSWIIGVVSEQLGSNSVEALFAKTPKKTICLMRLYSDLLFFDGEIFKADEVVRMTLRRYEELRDVPADLLDLVRTVNQHVADHPQRQSEDKKNKSKRANSSARQPSSPKREVDQDEDEEAEEDAGWTLEEFRTELRKTMLVLLRCAAKNGPDLFNELIGLWFEQKDLLCGDPDKLSLEEQFEQKVDTVEVEYEQAKFLLKEKHMFDEAAVALSQLNMRIENMLKEIPSKAVRKMLDPLLKRGGPSVKQRNPGAGSGLDADCSLVFTPTPSSHGDSQPSSAGSFGTADDSLTDDGESDDRFSNSSGLSPGSRSVSTSPVPAVDASGHAIEPVKTQMSSIKRWPHFGIDLGTDTSRSSQQNEGPGNSAIPGDDLLTRLGAASSPPECFTFSPKTLQRQPTQHSAAEAAPQRAEIAARLREDRTKVSTKKLLGLRIDTVMKLVDAKEKLRHAGKSTRIGEDSESLISIAEDIMRLDVAIKPSAFKQMQIFTGRGKYYMWNSQPSKALRGFDKCLGSKKKLLGLDHKSTIETQTKCAGTAIKFGNYNTALKYLLAVVDSTSSGAYRTLHGTKYKLDEFVAFYQTLAEAYLRIGNLRKAGAALKIVKDKVSALENAEVRRRHEAQAKLSKMAMHLHTMQLPECMGILQYMARSGIAELLEKFKVATAEATVHKVDASQFPKLTRVLDLALQNDLGQAAADKRPIGAVLNSAMANSYKSKLAQNFGKLLMLYDCHDEAEACFMKAMAHKHAALEKGRKHLSVTVTASLLCRNRRIRAHAAACLRVILIGCGCEDECSDWDGGRLLAECNSICAQLTMDSKGEGAAFRETLKLREIVDVEDAFRYAQMGRLDLACENLRKALQSNRIRKSNSRGSSKSRRGSSNGSHRRRPSGDFGRHHANPTEGVAGFDGGGINGGLRKIVVSTSAGADAAREKEWQTTSQVYSFVLRHDLLLLELLRICNRFHRCTIDGDRTVTAEDVHSFIGKAEAQFRIMQTDLPVPEAAREYAAHLAPEPITESIMSLPPTPPGAPFDEDMLRRFCNKNLALLRHIKFTLTNLAKADEGVRGDILDTNDQAYSFNSLMRTPLPVRDAVDEWNAASSLSSPPTSHIEALKNKCLTLWHAKYAPNRTQDGANVAQVSPLISDPHLAAYIEAISSPSPEDKAIPDVLLRMNLQQKIKAVRVDPFNVALCARLSPSAVFFPAFLSFYYIE